jgi:ATP-dependent DNA helicase RecG
MAVYSQQVKLRARMNDRTIRNAELRELLGLGDSASAQVEASSYLVKWSEADGFLDKHGGGNNVSYSRRAPV